MKIFFRGLGALVPPTVMFGFLGAALFAPIELRNYHIWHYGLVAIGVGLLHLALGVVFNRVRNRSKEARHTCMFIPIEFWGAFLLLLGGVVAGVDLAGLY